MRNRRVRASTDVQNAQLDQPALLRKSELVQLAEPRRDPCVSIYQPTHRAAPQTTQDPIRFKNLLAEARERLSSLGADGSETDKVLGEAEEVVRDSEFWLYQSDGLGCFIDGQACDLVKAPLNFEPRVCVDDRFWVRPLLPLLERGARFFIVALSQHSARLLQATEFAVDEAPLPGLDPGVGAVSQDRRTDADLHFHSSGQAGGPPMYHGNQGASDTEKADIMKFLRHVDGVLRDALRDTEGPVVLASVGYLARMYESVCSFKSRLAGKVPGNPDGWTNDELREKAFELAAPALRESRAQAIAKLEEKKSSDLVGAGAEDVLPAAAEGRVETLFVARDAEVTGAFDAQARAVTINRESTGNGESTGHDLIQMAAIETLRTDGDVYVVSNGELPLTSPLVANYRYAT